MRFVPVFHGLEQERRSLSMLPDIHNWLMSQGGGDGLSRLRAATKTHLAQFVKGEGIDDCNFMKIVSDKRYGFDDFSSNIWSIRPDFVPRIRLFGAFFREDWLVILTKKQRNELKTDHHWHAQIDVVCRRWSSLFPYTNRHSGVSVLDYMTANVEHCDDRW